MFEPNSKNGRWLDGTLPGNVRIGEDTVITGDYAFKRFRSGLDPALVVGSHGTFDGVHFAIGEQGRVEVGNYCYFTNAVLLCELELRIGSYVVIGWNATIADTAFPPLGPPEPVPGSNALFARGGGG